MFTLTVFAAVFLQSLKVLGILQLSRDYGRYSTRGIASEALEFLVLEILPDKLLQRRWALSFGRGIRTPSCHAAVRPPTCLLG